MLRALHSGDGPRRCMEEEMGAALGYRINGSGLVDGPRRTAALKPIIRLFGGEVGRCRRPLARFSHAQYASAGALGSTILGWQPPPHVQNDADDGNLMLAFPAGHALRHQVRLQHRSRPRALAVRRGKGRTP